MPYAADKLRINGSGLKSFWQIIEGWFAGILTVIAGGESLAVEIEEKGWSQEAEALEFLKEQEEDCTEIDDACRAFIKAQEKFHTRQMERNDRMRRFVDKKLAQQKTP